jgi:hypothetical protein
LHHAALFSFPTKKTKHYASRSEHFAIPRKNRCTIFALIIGKPIANTRVYPAIAAANRLGGIMSEHIWLLIALLVLCIIVYRGTLFVHNLRAELKPKYLEIKQTFPSLGIFDLLRLFSIMRSDEPEQIHQQLIEWEQQNKNPRKQHDLALLREYSEVHNYFHRLIEVETELPNEVDLKHLEIAPKENLYLDLKSKYVQHHSFLTPQQQEHLDSVLNQQANRDISEAVLLIKQWLQNEKEPQQCSRYQELLEMLQRAQSLAHQLPNKVTL